MFPLKRRCGGGLTARIHWHGGMGCAVGGTQLWVSCKGGANCRAPLGLWELYDRGPKAALVALRLPWAGLSLHLWCACTPPLSRKWMGVACRGFRQPSLATEGLLWRVRGRFQRKWGLSRTKRYGYRMKRYRHSEERYGYPTKRYRPSGKRYGYPTKRYRHSGKRYGYRTKRYRHSGKRYDYRMKRYRHSGKRYGCRMTQARCRDRRVGCRTAE